MPDPRIKASGREDDLHLHAILEITGLLGLTRAVKTDVCKEKKPKFHENIGIKLSQEINLR